MTSEHPPSGPSPVPPRPSGPPTSGIPIVQTQSPSRQSPSFLSRIPGGSWGASAATGALAYVGAAILGAVTWVALLAVTMGFSDASSGEFSGVSDSLGQDGAPSSAQLAILFAATAWLGPISLSGGFSIFSANQSFEGGLLFPLLSVTALVALGLFWAGRWAEGRWGSGGPLGRALVSLVTGLVTMLFVIFMPLIPAIRIREDDATLTMHGVSFVSALSALLIGTLFTFWGRTVQARRQGEAPAFGRVGGILREYGAAATLVLVHAAALGIVLYLLLVFGAFLAGEPGVAGAILLLPVNVAVWAFTLGNFGGFTAVASYSGIPFVGEGGTAMSGWVFSSIFFDGGALAVSLILFLVGLVILPFVGLRWLVKRNRAPGHLGTLGWATLPLTYLASGLFLLWFGRTSVYGSGGGIEAGASLAPAGWVVAVLLGIGLLIEVLARFLAPLLVSALPGGLVRLVGGREVAYAAAPTPAQSSAPSVDAPAGQTPAATAAAAATAEAVAPAPAAPATPAAASQPTPATAAEPVASTPAPVAPAAGQGAPPASGQSLPLTTRGPMSPQARKRTFRIVAAAVIVGVVVASAAITTAIVNRTTFGPAGVVEDYLAALRDGEAGTADALAPAEATSDQRGALNDEVFSAADLRITDYEVLDTQRSGDTAVVTASVTQDERASDVEFTLTRGDNRSGIFHGWSLDYSWALWATVQVPADVETILINGVEVPATGSAEPVEDAFGEADGEVKTLELALLPGMYTFSVPPVSKYQGFGEDQTLGYRLDSEDPNEGADLIFEAGYTQQLVDDVRAELETNLEQCIASKSFQPSGCANSSYISGEGDNYRNPSWQLVAAPIYTLELGYDGGIFATPEEPGQARLSYEYDQGFFDESDWVRRSDDVTLDATYDVVVDGESFDLRLQDPF